MFASGSAKQAVHYSRINPHPRYRSHSYQRRSSMRLERTHNVHQMNKMLCLARRYKMIATREMDNVSGIGCFCNSYKRRLFPMKRVTLYSAAVLGALTIGLALSSAQASVLFGGGACAPACEKPACEPACEPACAPVCRPGLLARIRAHHLAKHACCEPCAPACEKPACEPSKPACEPACEPACAPCSRPGLLARIRAHHEAKRACREACAPACEKPACEPCQPACEPACQPACKPVRVHHHRVRRVICNPCAPACEKPACEKPCGC